MVKKEMLIGELSASFFSRLSNNLYVPETKKGNGALFFEESISAGIFWGYHKKPKEEYVMPQQISLFTALPHGGMLY